MVSPLFLKNLIFLFIVENLIIQKKRGMQEDVVENDNLGYSLEAKPLDTSEDGKIQN